MFVSILYAFAPKDLSINSIIECNILMHKDKSDNLKILGLIIGGLLAIMAVILTTIRNDMTEEVNIKDAVTLLDNSNNIPRMGGVYALVEIATKNKHYAERINNILCKYIVTETKKEVEKTKNKE
ncbi:MAG: hypothetical protein LBH40_05615, partial [Alphaproteobacteria bacterium]|nr:hypothetical protein [Alphaproteobacteria bacterium]